jgi:hypothetical protein
MTRWILFYYESLAWTFPKRHAISRKLVVAKVFMWALIAAQLTFNTLGEIFGVGKDLDNLWNNYIITVIPILGYSVIYWKIRKQSRRFILLNQSYLSIDQVASVRKTVRSTLFFFVAICQYQVFRIVNVTVKFSPGLMHDVALRTASEVAFVLSEIVMLVCLCQSINALLGKLKGEGHRGGKHLLGEDEKGGNRAIQDRDTMLTVGGGSRVEEGLIMGRTRLLSNEEASQRRDSDSCTDTST